MRRARSQRSVPWCLVVLVLFAFLVPVAAGANSGPEVSYRIPGPGRLSVASTQSFSGWYRYPAEERNWLQMTSATAYNRDVLVGGETFVSGASDGDYWHADARLPNGTTQTWGAIRFYSSYNGQQNCFVSPFWYICGTNSIIILWYTDGQCQPTGSWTMNFYANGAQFHSGQFTLLPQIPPNKVPLQNQVSYTDAYDTICRTGTQRNSYHCDGRANEVAWTIRGKGCALTSGSMMLSYHGVAVDPPTLNTWMINNRGFDLRGNIYWDAIARYGRQAGTTITYLGANGNLETQICRYGPQIVSVNNGGHWVAPTGRDANKTTYQINDPNGGLATTLANLYGNVHGSQRYYSGPEYTYTDMTGIVIRFHSPGELLLADPLGRITGFDPTNGQAYQEIPDSVYSLIGLDDVESGEPGPLSHDLDIRQPLEGEYRLQVVGTGTGTYDLEINTYDPDSNPSQATFLSVPITPGAVHAYSFDYSRLPNAPVVVGGAFDGGGQRPRDVNKFLTYGSPGDNPTALPAGTTSYAMLVFYGATILPSTFQATLNGVDITAMFQPVPGGNQLVSLPLQSGRNVLLLSVNGNLPSRTATDTDRLIFSVL